MACNVSLLDPDCLGQADGAGGPPTDWGELVQVHDDRDVCQSSPDPASAMAMICGSITSYFGVRRSGTTTSRRPRGAFPRKVPHF